VCQQGHACFHPDSKRTAPSCTSPPPPPPRDGLSSTGCRPTASHHTPFTLHKSRPFHSTCCWGAPCNVPCIVLVLYLWVPSHPTAAHKVVQGSRPCCALPLAPMLPVRAALVMSVHGDSNGGPGASTAGGQAPSREPGGRPSNNPACRCLECCGAGAVGVAVMQPELMRGGQAPTLWRWGPLAVVGAGPWPSVRGTAQDWLSGGQVAARGALRQGSRRCTCSWVPSLGGD
jgi:hypothetical protein